MFFIYIKELKIGFSKQDVEFSKQEMEFFFPLIDLWLKNFFYKFLGGVTEIDNYKKFLPVIFRHHILPNPWLSA